MDNTNKPTVSAAFDRIERIIFPNFVLFSCFILHPGFLGNGDDRKRGSNPDQSIVPEHRPTVASSHEDKTYPII